MRKSLLATGVLAASLGLAACGASSTKATLHELLTSLGSSSDLQVTLTASASGIGSAEAQEVLGAVSVQMRYSNPSGGPLSQSAGNANTELLFKTGSTTFFDVREINQNVYAYLDVSALSSIPGVKLTPAQSADLQLVVGGRWFEFPKRLIAGFVPKTSVDKAATNKVRAIEAKIVDDLANLIETTPSKKLGGGGYSETGTLESIVTAVAPTIEGLTHHAPTSRHSVKGTYTLTVTTSGSSATGASVSITAPTSSGATATVGLSAKIAHANDAVVAPKGATVITPALLRQLFAGRTAVSSISSTSRGVAMLRTVSASQRVVVVCRSGRCRSIVALRRR